MKTWREKIDENTREWRIANDPTWGESEEAAEALDSVFDFFGPPLGVDT